MEKPKVLEVEQCIELARGLSPSQRSGMAKMSVVLDDSDIDDPEWDDVDFTELVECFDALDGPPACPRCASSIYEHDVECRAWVCDACGLWLDDDTF